MMRRVHPPLSRRAERQSECAEAIEPAMMQVVDRAEEAGWTRLEALRAALDLAARELDRAPKAMMAEVA